MGHRQGPKWFKVQVTRLDDSSGRQDIEFTLVKRATVRKRSAKNSWATPLLSLTALLANHHLVVPGSDLDWKDI